MEDLVSVIIPVYNVEKYLNRCVKSIVEQTYKCLEIILVDDGSLDQCPYICDEWSQRDNRVRVLHKSNGGLSDARNAGLSVATGKYIAFVDSDDWVHESYIEQLYAAIKKYNVGIAACDVSLVYDENQQKMISSPSIKVYEREEALCTLINGKTFRAVVWNKLYNKELLEKERFEIGRYHEDEFFTYRILGKVPKMVFVDAELYYYFQREGSIMNSISYKHLDYLDAYINRINYFRHDFPILYKIDKMRFCMSCINFYQDTIKLNGKERKQCIIRIKLCRAKIHFNLSEYKNYSIKELIYIVGSRLCIGLVSRLLLHRREKRN